jgi:DNA-binding transcriptional MerR regulator
MRPADVLKEVPISRERLYYLEQKGYIDPKKTVRGDRELRDYSQRDLEIVRLMWKYIEEGFRYKIAYQKALKDLNSNPSE